MTDTAFWDNRSAESQAVGCQGAPRLRAIRRHQRSTCGIGVRVSGGRLLRHCTAQEIGKGDISRQSTDVARTKHELGDDLGRAVHIARRRGNTGISQLGSLIATRNNALAHQRAGTLSHRGAQAKIDKHHVPIGRNDPVARMRVSMYVADTTDHSHSIEHAQHERKELAGRKRPAFAGAALNMGKDVLTLDKALAQAEVLAANTEQILRIIQSIPSPKAEPFRLWLAAVGRERIEETIDPEQAIDRALETYQKKGYDADWIHQRILSIRVRNELTAEWQARGVEQGREYAILTDEITKAWSGMTTRQYKNLKGLKKENLRDNMSTLEIVLNMLAETTTTELSKAHRPEGFEESRIVARRGGKVAGDARRAIEADTGRPAVTAENAAQLNAVVTDVIEGVAEADKPNGDEK